MTSLRFVRSFRFVVSLCVVLAATIALLWNTEPLRRVRSVSRAPADVNGDAKPTPLAPLHPARESAGAVPARQAERGLSGTVVDAEDGKPVPGAFVFTCDPAVERQVPVADAVRSDQDGAFSLERDQVRGPQLQTIARGYAPATAPVPTSSEPIRVALERGLTLAGHVRDDLDRPVRGARVWAHRSANQVAWPDFHESLAVGRLAEGGSAGTDERGRFEIRGLARGLYEVRGAKTGWTFPDWEDPPAAEAGDAHVTLVMYPVRTLVVKHVDADTGEPVRCVLTSISRTRAVSPAVPTTADLARGEAMLHGEPEGFDPARGITRISFGLMRSRAKGALVQTLRCKAPGYKPFSAEVDVSEGDPELVVVARMEPAARGKRGSIRVETYFGGSNLPFDGMLQLMIQDESSRNAGIAVVEVADGVAQAPLPLPAGRYLVRPRGCGDVGQWWIDAGPKRAFALGVGQEDLRVRLEVRGNPLRLAVVDDEGREVHGYDLVIHPGNGAIFGGVRRWDAPGNHTWLQRSRASYDGPDLILPAGEAVVRAVLRGVGAASARIDVPGDGKLLRLSMKLAEE